MTSFQSSTNTADGLLCTVKLPLGFSLSPQLLKASPNEMAIAFEYASTFLSKQDELKDKEVFQIFFKKCEMESQKELKQKDEKITRLEQAASELKQRNYELLEKQKENFTTILEPYQRNWEQSSEKRLQEVRNSSAAQIQEIKSGNQRLIELLEKQISQEKSKVTDLETKLIQKTANQSSVKKGKEGEQEFEALVQQKKGWNLTNVGKTPHSADSIGTIHNVNLRFELKKYSGNVPTEQVNKLRNDMAAHPETDIGVFISLDTGIAGMDEFQVEYTPRNQFILYISNFLTSDIHFMLDVIENFILALKPYRALLDRLKNTENTTHLQEKITRSILYAQNLLKRNLTAASEYELNRRAVQDRFDQLNSSIKANLSDSKSEIDMLLNILADKEINVTTTEAPSVLPVSQPGQKKKRVSKNKTIAPV
jgi:hypothetical protein